MKNSIKIWIGIIILIALIVTTGLYVAKLSGNAVKDDKPVVKIGVIIPLTGESSFMGVGSQRALELANSKLKNTKYDYELIYEDNKNFDNKEALSAIQKLINIDKVDAVLSFSSGTGNVVSPLAEQNKIIHISWASDPNVAKGKYNFIHSTTPKSENKVFVEELQKKGIKKLAVIVINQQGLLAITNDLENMLKETDIKLVSKDIFNPGEKDFKTILLKAKETNPDIYFVEAYSPDLEILAKQAKELGITKLTSIEAFELSATPELFNGLWFVSSAEPTFEFRNTYIEKYNDNPSFGSANLYDSFNLIVTAYENAGKSLGANEKPKTLGVADFLLKIKGFKGVLGELKVSDDGIFDSEASVKEIKNGKPVLVGE